MSAPAAPPAAPPVQLVLASRSPRRSQLLSMLGLTFETVPADIDEAYRSGEDPGEHAERLAREKALSVAVSRPGSLVVGSDTVVVVGGVVLGKPESAEQAIDMLLRLQGREHTVATGVAVARDTAVASAVEKVAVHFRAFGRETAGAYVATGEPLDKAGAYGIQGYGAALVERIEGDYFAVMGLPVCRLLQIMASMGFRYDFRSLKPQ